ncbi:MAG: hypothetical protein H6809_01255 [Phycisphaeraceae bacterium]|nr:hypothetical protein [Phycisphaeraceae bacterium]
MQHASPRDHESTSPAGATSRGLRWERLGVGVAVGLVLMTALGSAWGMLVGAVAALGVIVVWELLARR